MPHPSSAILVLDEGTTGVTVGLYSLQFDGIDRESIDFPQHFPQSGWVEHKTDEIWGTFLKCWEKLHRRHPHLRIECIGITNQRETTAFWDRKTGKPLRNAIVWQDRRTQELCKKIRKDFSEAQIRKKFGLVADPYFSSTKIAWALREDAGLRTAAKSGQLCVGTIDSFLVFKLTGGKSFVTEASNASRTLLWNLQNEKWDEDFAKYLKIPLGILPEVHASFTLLGKTQGVPHLPDGIPITGMLGDQQSALLGHKAVIPGDAKCTYGTGAFLLCQTGTKRALSSSGLLTTVAWKTAEGKTSFALEGSTFSAGSSVQWVRDSLKLIEKSADIEALAKKCDSTDGVYFVPALAGLGAPYWNPEARGVLGGLSRGSEPSHIARAVLEGLAHTVADVFECIEKDLKKSGVKPIRKIHVDGGASENRLLMQMQSDFLGKKLLRPQDVESTSRGAAYASAIGAKILKSPEDIPAQKERGTEFNTSFTAKRRRHAREQWQIRVPTSFIKNK